MNPSEASRWIDVGSSNDLSESQAVEVVAEDQVIAIFRQRGQLYAIDGVCAHQGGPIATGEVHDGCVTCPWHGWQYELATGIQTINKKPLQRVFQVRERDGRIEIGIDDESYTP
ncbi:Rieske (2Fe-2S) protein [Novipirellula artificiosorum]|uniref:Anthranilate 1,2-dioxygenase ferredoxin subunit n=1 Tax=Novipirellula artificiosorum TaxID=2528016 RepID=A0A5C6D8V8_9BACT|nr:Rieske 2Fe-2S domain-containing protein [Novipirellula artificiosorum]TWU33372.1 Anthranilate 1,2-dioxygenase ferredoxin subunit [Novipirellula artificiosorum]